MSEEEKEVLAMFNSVGLNIEVDNKAAALWFSLGGVFVKKITSLRTELDAYKAALQRVVNDSAQDEIEDPVGHSKRFREGFERIHKNAVQQCVEALRKGVE